MGVECVIYLIESKAKKKKKIKKCASAPWKEQNKIEAEKRHFICMCLRVFLTKMSSNLSLKLRER